jgi:hypothetical protein
MVVTFLTTRCNIHIMSMDALVDKLQNLKKYCLERQHHYNQLHQEETLLMHMRYDNKKSVLFAKRVISIAVNTLLCPYTWAGSTAAFIVSLPDTTTAATAFTTFSLMIWCFSMSLWLTMNIYNVRGKQLTSDDVIANT